jgi:hypothetical protein
MQIKRMINPKPSLQNLTMQGEMRNIANVYMTKIVAYYENKMKTDLREWQYGESLKQGLKQEIRRKLKVKRPKS